MKWVRFRSRSSNRHERVDRAGCTSKIYLEVKENDSEQATLGSTTRDVLIIRLGTIVADTHFSVREVGNDKAESTGGDIEVSQDGHYDIVVYPIKGFAKVNQTSEDSSWFGMVFIKVLVDEVEH